MLCGITNLYKLHSKLIIAFYIHLLYAKMCCTHAAFTHTHTLYGMLHFMFMIRALYRRYFHNG